MQLRRLRSPIAIAVALLLLAAACGTESEPSTGEVVQQDPAEDPAEDPGELVISTFGGSWGRNVELALVEPFEAATGIDVTVLQTQELPAARAAVEAGQPSPYDISTVILPTAVDLNSKGLLEPIDYSVFEESTLEEIDNDEVLGDFYVGYAHFAIGLCYDAEAYPDGGPQPSNWEDFWDTETFPGNRSLIGWHGGGASPEFPLLADGVAPDDLYPLDIDRAYERLEELVPAIPRFADGPAPLQQMMVDGQVQMIACFTHRVRSLLDAGLTRDIRISFDQARVDLDQYVVWKDAPNLENAMRFLAFIVEAENQARWAQLNYIGPVNPAAFELIPEDKAAFLPTSPEHETTFRMDALWYAETTPDGRTNLQVINDRWQEFSAGL
jgi:putative spermidine/putrescine transport system substrate-binding protein